MPVIIDWSAVDAQLGILLSDQQIATFKTNVQAQANLDSVAHHWNAADKDRPTMEEPTTHMMVTGNVADRPAGDGIEWIIDSVKG